MNYTPIKVSLLRKASAAKINKSPWFVLLGILIIMLQIVQADSGRMINPLPAKQDIFSQVKSRLAQVVNTYKIKTGGVSLIPQVNAESDAAPDSNAYAVIDYDSGEVIAEKNLSRPVPIASVTKIMTAVVALDLVKPDEMITVTQRAADAIPTKIVLQPGDKLSLLELLNASLLTSANDATEAIRDGIDAKYGEEVFMKAMNEKADLIGLKNTHYANPQGFDDPDHYSSAEDLAVLAHYALTNYPVIADIVKKDHEFLAASALHGEHDLVNWNGLLDVYPNIFGVKIGNTDAAGTTTVVAAERDGKRVLAVLLGASNVLSRDLEAAGLLDLGFYDKYNLPPVNVTEDELRAKYATWN